VTVVPKWWTRPLVHGEQGRDVQVVQRKLGVLEPTYDDITRAHVRGFQQKMGLEVDGMVGPLTASALGETADHALPPPWFTRDLGLGAVGEDVAGLRGSLGLSPGENFDDETRRAVLRFQSANGMNLTGRADRTFALQLP
jgi:peptidoglycan hydrolase-like protein with peptidoglycan-binding domain